MRGKERERREEVDKDRIRIRGEEDGDVGILVRGAFRRLRSGEGGVG